MKLPAFVLFILTCSISVFGQNRLYVIKGKLPGVKPSSRVFLKYSQNHKTVVDSALVYDGIFEFKGAIAEPVQAFIYLETTGKKSEQSDRTDLYLEAGTILISSADFTLKHATVQGTPANADRSVLLSMTQKSADDYSVLLQKRSSATDEQKGSASYQKELDSLELEILHASASARIGFIKAHPNSVVSLIQLDNLRYFKIAPDKLGSLFNGLSPELRGYSAGLAFKSYLDELRTLEPGSQAPDLFLPDKTGRINNLKAFRGKYVLLDFWASWCVPCRQENPNIANTLKRFEKNNFTVISISLDKAKDKKKWLAAVEADGLNWLQLIDAEGFQGRSAKLYHVNSIPQNFLIGPDGTIIEKNLRGPELQHRLQEIFIK